MIPSAQACKRTALFCTIVSSAHNPPLIIFSPVAQHLPAGAVREARDALVEFIRLDAPANEQGAEAQEFAVGGSGVQLVGAVLADAGQDFSANGLVREVLVVVAVGFAAGLSTLSCRPQVASTRDSGRQTAKNTRLVTAMRLRASRRDAPPSWPGWPC